MTLLSIALQSLANAMLIHILNIKKYKSCGFGRIDVCLLNYI